MADPDLRARADQRFEQALQQAGARDPRDFYRTLLRDLKAASPDAYRRALGYYEQRLIPAVAADDGDPLAEWLEYGRVLASLAQPGGRTVAIDPAGAAGDYARPVAADALVLHLPERAAEPALAIGLPAKMSAAQRASFALLVKQAKSL